MDEPREPRDGDRPDSPASKGEGRLRVLPPVPGSEAPPPASSSDEPIVDYPPLTDDLRRSAAELEVRLFAHATDHPECRAKTSSSRQA